MMMSKRNNDFDLWKDLFDDPFFSNHETKLMRTDIKEGDDNYSIIIDLPGYKKENIKIDIEDGYLNIAATTDIDDEKKDGKFVRRERYFGECSRSFYVGDEITEEDIHATFKDGILKLDIPKKEEKKQINSKRYIEISD